MNKALAARIRERREELGISQMQLAVASSVSQKQICALENGAIKRTKKIPALANALGVNVDWLATGEGDKEKITIPVGDKKIVLTLKTIVSHQIIENDENNS